MDKLNRIYHECKEELLSLGIPVGNIISVDVLNGVSKWGDCEQTRNGYKIRVSNKLLNEGTTKSIKDTMIHELLHTIPNGMKHTGEWKKAAEMVNKKLGYNIQRCNSDAEKGVNIKTYEKGFKFKLTCTNCKNAFYYKNRCKTIIALSNPQCKDFRCPYCGRDTFVLKEF